MTEAWHKQHALQLASQLPDKVEDANLVIQTLQELVSTWRIRRRKKRRPRF
jgi:hypothetical protein